MLCEVVAASTGVPAPLPQLVDPDLQPLAVPAAVEDTVVVTGHGLVAAVLRPEVVTTGQREVVRRTRRGACVSGRDRRVTVVAVLEVPAEHTGLVVVLRVAEPRDVRVYLVRVITGVALAEPVPAAHAPTVEVDDLANVQGVGGPRLTLLHEPAAEPDQVGEVADVQGRRRAAEAPPVAVGLRDGVVASHDTIGAAVVATPVVFIADDAK